jgi:hypothetical protein
MDETGEDAFARMEAELDAYFGSELARAEASDCYAADTCVMDETCPFIRTCKIAVGRG